MARDPACGMTVDGKKAAASTTYEEKMFLLRRMQGGLRVCAGALRDAMTAALSPCACGRHGGR